MSIQSESPEPPEGFETRRSKESPPPDAERPDWLVGADDVLESAHETPSRPTLPAPAPPGPRPLEVVPGGRSERPKAWSAAASSVPKLTVVPKRDRAASPDPEDDSPGLGPMDDPLTPPGMAEGSAGAAPAGPPAFQPLNEPWYLVWGEALLTNRKLQIAAAAVLVLAAVLWFRPRLGQDGASLGTILRHPERYEGRSVAVRGEVLESFEVGEGHAFQLRQGRDTVVVFSRSRHPRLHERVEVVGTVSTGYLDGEPRVAIFETPRGK
jgi:hypothetical protein